MMSNIKLLSGYCVLNVHQNVIYAAKGYKIYKSTDEGNTWELEGWVDDLKFSLIANTSRLLARFTRAEITTIQILEDGTRVLIARKGIFVADKGEKIYKKTFHVMKGSRPLNMCLDGKENLYFGDYFLNHEREEINIYKSENSGKTWEVCYAFPKKTIRHVHGIFYDKYKDLVWFATGDFGNECIIGNTNNGFETIEIFKQGKQKYRAVDLMFYEDFIVYGTDTEVAKNYIYRIDRKDGQEYCLANLQGSVLSSAKTDEGAVISTAVEPSEVNHDVYSHIWFSKDGLKWNELYKAKKDFLPPKLWQYGRFKFPIGAIDNGKLLFSGHALEGLDNKTVIYSLNTCEH